MQNAQLIKNINELIQLDIDATFAYEQALKGIDDQQIFKMLESFQRDHVRHGDKLAVHVTRLGGTPPKRTKDVKGYIITGFTAITGLVGIKSILTAMIGNEKLTNREYASAVKWDLGPEQADLLDLIEQNYNDEKRHLEYIQKTLDVLKNAS